MLIFRRDNIKQEDPCMLIYCKVILKPSCIRSLVFFDVCNYIYLNRIYVITYICDLDARYMTPRTKFVSILLNTADFKWGDPPPLVQREGLATPSSAVTAPISIILFFLESSWFEVFSILFFVGPRCYWADLNSGKHGGIAMFHCSWYLSDLSTVQAPRRFLNASPDQK